MKPLGETHQSVDSYQTDHSRRRTHVLSSRRRLSMPSKKEPGYGEETITLEEWRELNR